MECGELLRGKTILVKLKGAVCMNYVDPAILYRSNVCRLTDHKMAIL